MGPAVSCPRCRRELVKGSLRCRFCGQDAREARPAGDLALGFDEVQQLLDDPPDPGRKR